MQESYSSLNPQMSSPGHEKKHWIVLGIVAACVVLVIIGIVLIVRREPAPVSQPVPTDVNGVPGTQEATGLPSANGQAAPVEDEPAAPLVDNFPDDRDRDGIPDAEEAEYGTSNESIDSDNDGLSDYLEIMVWGTDPNNPDTDGDGYIDGIEVLSGFNPNGDGRIE